MFIILSILAIGAISAYFEIYYVASGLYAGLLIFYLMRGRVMKGLLEHDELPVCFVNKHGKIVAVSRDFAENISNIKHEHIQDVFTVNDHLVMLDRTGRTWSLINIKCLNLNGFMFYPAPEGNDSWVYELPIPACVIDNNMNFLAVNKQFLEYIDQNWQEYSMQKYIAKARIRDWKNILAKVKDTHNTENIELLWQGNIGTTVRLSVKPHDDGFIVFLNDIQELEHIKQQAQKAQNLQVMGHLTASVVHDFNNLLSAISGFCYILQNHLSADHEAAKDVREIQNTTARAQEMTKQLLELSADKAGVEQFTDPVTVINESMSMLRMLTHNGDMNNPEILIRLNIAEDYECQPSKFLVGLSKAQILQVIVNLVVNARDAHAKHITISMEFENIIGAQKLRSGVITNNDYVVINVLDDGDGIPDNVQNKLLAEFYSTKEKGAGIGLATLARMLSMNGGGVDFESVAGKTVFRIYMPRQSVEKKIAQQSSRTVLLVEDDALVRDLTKRALTYNGYDVIVAEDGMVALEMIDSGTKFDLLITDAIMPRMNGIKLIEEVKRRGVEVPIFFMSGVNSQELQERLPAGIIILTKPMQVKDLINVLREY